MLLALREKLALLVLLELQDPLVLQVPLVRVLKDLLALLAPVVSLAP